MASLRNAAWSLSAIASALRVTTETLAQELAAPSETAPRWLELEWLVARATTSMHGVSPVLSTRLRWRGPKGWAEFLAEQRAHTSIRHRRIWELLGAMSDRMRSAGVAAIALKGPALHAIGLYAPGERPMADIDLLVRQSDLEGTARILETCGFRQTYATWKDRTFEPAEFSAPARLGENSANYLKIELHDRVGDVLALRPVDISAAIFSGDSRPGVSSYPSQASLMLHLILHAAGDMASKTLRLLNLHDIALLSGRMTSVDWEELMRLGAMTGGTWWAYPPLALTARYYRAAIPPGTLAALAGGCPKPLRSAAARQTLSDVSLSYLWISAFPGIRWTRSLGEATEYVRRRIFPGAERLSARERFVNMQPFLTESAWAQLSQARRVLRWVTLRPPRPATMHVVREALLRDPDAPASAAQRVARATTSSTTSHT